MGFYHHNNNDGLRRRMIMEVNAHASIYIYIYAHMTIYLCIETIITMTRVYNNNHENMHNDNNNLHYLTFHVILIYAFF